MFAIALIRSHAIRLTSIIFLLLSSHALATAQCTLTNPDFENGTLTGWTNYFRSSGTGQWYNYTGTTSPLSLHSISAPPQGSRAAVTDQTAATTHALYQDATIPSGTFATLSFYLYWNNTHTQFVTLNTLDYTNNQQARVDLIKTTTADIESVAATDVIAKLFQTKNGDTLFQTPLLYTYNLGGFGGQTVRLRFAEAVGINYFPVGIDNVCLSNTAMVNTRNISVGSNRVINFGSVEVVFPSVTVAGTTTAQATDPSLNTGPPVGESFIGPSYDISTTATFTGQATVCLNLPEINNDTTFNNLRLLHKVGGVWIDVPSSRKSVVGRQLCGDVPTLSPFAVGLQPLAPTAAATRISGQVTTADGQPLGGVIMDLGGAESRRTITKADGTYSFDVAAGSFYTVRATRGNYSFAPDERTFSSVGTVLDAGFAAVADSVALVNPLDTDLFFVRQQYLDFLAREPDHGGLDYWSNHLLACGTDESCLRRERIGVGAAFFVESEFQDSGSFIYRLYNAGLGRRVSYAEFSADRPQVVGGRNLSAARIAFANQFVTREEFQQRYVASQTSDSFVNSLLTSVRGGSGTDLSAQRTSLVEVYNQGSSMNESRSLMLRELIEIAQYKQAVYNSSFVAMQYFGYLRRGPDEGGYRFWLDILDRDPTNYRGMVCSFLTSAEYQRRFSTVVTHSNAECGR